MPYGSPYGDIYRGRENPVENALSAMAGVQGFFARQEVLETERDTRREQNKLRQIMEGQDWKNPDVGRIMSIAPNYGMKFLQNLNQMNMQQRLVATEKAKEGMEYFKTALVSLRNNPGGRQETIDTLVKMGVDPGLANMIPKYNGDPKQFQQDIDILQAPVATLSGIARVADTEVKARSKQDEMAKRLQIVQAKGGYDLAVANTHQATEALKKLPAGKTVLFHDEKTGTFKFMMADALGRTKTVDVPPELGVPYEKPGKEGKSKEGQPGIDLSGGKRRPGGVGPMETMPPAADHSGRIIKDTTTGKRFKSNGTDWVPME